jgi:proteasome lid subunit RPN8/RPN11
VLDVLDKHFSSCYPNEACGFVLTSGEYIPLVNISNDPLNSFRVSVSDFLKYNNNIRYIVHSHPDSPCTPSIDDIEYCTAVGVPFLIYSYPSFDSVIIQPQEDFLLGKEYIFGVNDCLQSCIKYYSSIGILIDRDIDFLDNWWDLNLDYFNHKYITSKGFVKVDSLQPNDFLLFNVKCSVANHCGVYVGSDNFLHHAINRCSTIENLYPFWHKFISGIYRYEKKG